MRASALSDDVVISMVNDNFVPLAINVTSQGFPVDTIPALKHFETVYKTNWRFAFGFAGCACINSDGTIPLSHSAVVKDPSSAFSNEKWIEFLIKSIERNEKLGEMQTQFKRGDIFAGFASLQAIVAEYVRDAQAQVQSLLQFQRMSRSLDDVSREVERESHGMKS